jgi:hypothetical protein
LETRKPGTEGGINQELRKTGKRNSGRIPVFLLS